MVTRQSVEHAVGLTLLALIAIGTFLVLRPFLSAILWAAVLCYATWPLFIRLKNGLGGRAGLAALIMIMAVACVLVTPIAVLMWSMADEVVRLSGIVFGWFQTGLPALPVWVGDIPFLGGKLLKKWHDVFQTGDLSQNLAPYVTTLRGQLTAIAATTASALAELLLSLLIAFVLYCNGPALNEILESLGEKLTGERGRRLIDAVGSTTRSVVKGLIGTNLLQAVLGALGFWAAGVPGAMLLGFFIFFLTVIPLGTAIVWIPAVIWVVNKGDSGTAILLAVWCVLIFGLLENIARPFLVGRGSTVPSILILLGMLGGMSAFGFLGIFLGPALLALLYVLIEEWRRPVRKSRTV